MTRMTVVSALGRMGCAALISLASARADNIEWDAEGGTADNAVREWQYDGGTNWVGDLTPTSVDNAWVNGNYTAVVSQAGATANFLLVGSSDAPVTGSNPTGMVLMTGGDLLLENDVILGEHPGDVGSLVMTDGTMTIPDDALYLGYEGIGRMTVTGNASVVMTGGDSDANLYVGLGDASGPEDAGSTLYLGGNADVSVGYDLHVGYYAGAHGVVYMAGGEMRVTNHLMLGRGAGALGEVVIKAGLLDVSRIGFIGTMAGGTGIVSVSGGTLNVERESLLVGDLGHGILDVSGTATVKLNAGHADLVVGDNSADSNTVALSGNGVIIIPDDLRVGLSAEGARGVVRITDNGRLTVGNEIAVGIFTNSSGRVEMSGGLLETQDGTFYIGEMGHGIVSVSGTATVDVNGASGDLRIGVESSASNTLEISGSGVVDVADELVIGSASSGSRGIVRLQDSGRMTVRGNMLIAQRSETIGIVEIGGGTYIASNVVLVANASNAMGRISISDGLFSSATHMAVGNAANATGRLTVSGGSVAIGGNLIIGNNGAGFLSISDGSLTTAGNLVVNDGGESSTVEVIGALPLITVGSGATEDFTLGSAAEFRAFLTAGGIAPVKVQDNINAGGTLTVDAIGGVANGVYVIATSLNQSAVSGTFATTNWLGGLSGTVSYDDHRIAVTITNGTSSLYDTWAAGFGLVGSDASPTNDPDNDTWRNLTEYGHGGNPTNQNDAAVYPEWQVLPDGSLEVVYRRRVDYESRGLSYEVQAESNIVLGAWSTNGTEEIGSEILDAEFESVTNRIEARGTLTVGRIQIGLE